MLSNNKLFKNVPHPISLCIRWGCLPHRDVGKNKLDTALKRTEHGVWPTKCSASFHRCHFKNTAAQVTNWIISLSCLKLSALPYRINYPRPAWLATKDLSTPPQSLLHPPLFQITCLSPIFHQSLCLFSLPGTRTPTQKFPLPLPSAAQRWETVPDLLRSQLQLQDANPLIPEW